MRIILDSNEYILGLDTTAGPCASSRLLDLVRILIDESEEFRLLLPEIIVRNEEKKDRIDTDEHRFLISLYEKMDTQLTCKLIRDKKAAS